MDLRGDIRPAHDQLGAPAKMQPRRLERQGALAAPGHG
jgi:hypothetical protein